jgi:four helix bundle protein
LDPSPAQRDELADEKQPEIPVTEGSEEDGRAHGAKKDGRTERRKDGKTGGALEGRALRGRDDPVVPEHLIFARMMAFERLQAWREAHQLALSVYRLTAEWPAAERYGLISQARRAAVSVPSNIVEGAAKRGVKELGRHLDIAIGSFAELTYLLRLAHDMGYSSPQEWGALDPIRARTGRLLWGLYRKVRPKRETEGRKDGRTEGPAHQGRSR